MRPRLLLADDHAMVAKALGKLLERVGDLLATVTDGAQLVERAHILRPDIIVTDVNIPHVNGLDAMRQLKAGGLHSKFVFVTVHADAQLVAGALRDGASGFVFKPAAGDELVDAIQAVVGGGTYVTPTLSRKLRR